MRVRSEVAVRIELTAEAKIKLEEWVLDKYPSDFTPKFHIVDISPSTTQVITIWLGVEGE